MNKNSKITAFTLAEVLITLAIIGVVAAVTLPTFITNINERRNSERQANIAQKVTQAMEHMRALGKLTPYASTEDFVNELKNHLKITKICYKDNIADCWPTDKIIDSEGKEYNVADAKNGITLGKETDTNNVGLILADGASIILNYDNKSEGLDVGAPVTSENKPLPVGQGKSKEFPYTSGVTGAIDFVMDVNGKNKPNREKDSSGKQYDIRSFKTARFSPYIPWEKGPAGKILYIGTLSESQRVNCWSSNSSSEDYQTYCGLHPSGSQDYWAGAKKACVDATFGKGKLPNIAELQNIRTNRSGYPSLNISFGGAPAFFTSEEYSAGEAYYIYLNNDRSDEHASKGNQNLYVLCIEN